MNSCNVFMIAFQNNTLFELNCLIDLVMKNKSKLADNLTVSEHLTNGDRTMNESDVSIVRVKENAQTICYVM